MQDTVDISLRGLSRWGDAITGKGPAVRRALDQVSRIFAAFVRRRFVIFSRGGGDWPPLKPATIARRRRRSSVILRDTGLLFSQHHPQIIHVTRERFAFGAAVRFGGHARYPDGVSVTDVMVFHQTGAGRLPVRRIIVRPDQKTRDQMSGVLKRAVQQDARNR